MKALKIALAAAALAAAGSAAAGGKVLVVASSETQMALRGGKTTPVGYFLNELAVPSLIMRKAGYEIELATPKGNVPAMDKGSDSDGFFKGYRMTVFSDAEEWPGEASHGSYMPFHVEDALLNAGMSVEIAPPFTSHIVIDRELISGQNPASDEAVGEAMVQVLSKAR